jgi:hypothetical protein
VTQFFFLLPDPFSSVQGEKGQRVKVRKPLYLSWHSREKRRWEEGG